MATQNAINNINAKNDFTRQAVVNGNFNIAQRGTSFTNPTNVALTLDRFNSTFDVDGGTAPTLTHSQTALTSGELSNAYYQYRLTTNGAGSGFGTNSFNLLSQQIKRGTSLLAGASQTVTVSFKARNSIASKKIGVFLIQNYGTGGSPSAQEVIVGQTYTLTSSFQTITKTFTLNTLSGKTFGTSLNDVLKLDIVYQWGSTWGTNQLGDSTAESFGGTGTVDIAQLQLCAGSVALNFQPKTFNQDLYECMEDYQKSFSYDVVPADNTGDTGGTEIIHTQATSSTHAFPRVRFVPAMSITPTVTLYNPSASSADKLRNATDSTNHPGAVDAITNKIAGIYVNGSSIAALKDVRTHWTAATGF